MLPLSANFCETLKPFVVGIRPSPCEGVMVGIGWAAFALPL